VHSEGHLCFHLKFNWKTTARLIHAGKGPPTLSSQNDLHEKANDTLLSSSIDHNWVLLPKILGQRMIGFSLPSRLIKIRMTLSLSLSHEAVNRQFSLHNCSSIGCFSLAGSVPFQGHCLQSFMKHPACPMKLGGGITAGTPAMHKERALPLASCPWQSHFSRLIHLV